MAKKKIGFGTALIGGAVIGASAGKKASKGLFKWIEKPARKGYQKKHKNIYK